MPSCPCPEPSLREGALSALCAALARAIPRRLWLVCLAWATFGEIVLALVWGLYEYRLHNIPLFVPPAHALVFVLGIAICKRMPDSIIWTVPLAAAPPVLALAWAVHTGRYHHAAPSWSGCGECHRCRYRCRRS